MRRSSHEGLQLRIAGRETMHLDARPSRVSISIDNGVVVWAQAG